MSRGLGVLGLSFIHIKFSLNVTNMPTKIQRFICLTARIYLLTILLLANMLTIFQSKRIKVLLFK